MSFFFCFSRLDRERGKKIIKWEHFQGLKTQEKLAKSWDVDFCMGISSEARSAFSFFFLLGRKTSGGGQVASQNQTRRRDVVATCRARRVQHDG